MKALNISSPISQRTKPSSEEKSLAHGSKVRGKLLWTLS